MFLDNCSVDDDDLATIAIGLKAKNGITSLSLADTDVSDHGVAHLNGLCFYSINLGGTEVSDASVKLIAEMETLRELLLETTAITDQAITHLGSLGRLSSLDLTNTAVTDSAIESLEQMSNLHFVSLRGTSCSEEGVKRLQESLPNAIVLGP